MSHDRVACRFLLNGEYVQELVIPETVTTLNRGLLNRVESLVSVTFPKGLTSLTDEVMFSGQVVFYVYNNTLAHSYCKEKGLDFWVLDSTEANTITGTVGDATWSINRVTGEFYLDGDAPESYNSSPWAKYMSYIRTITLSENTHLIRYGVFRGSYNLTRINFSKSCSTIEREAFAECTSLITVTLPDTIKSMNLDVFKDCTKLETLIYPSKLEFKVLTGCNGCTNLKRVVIPEGIEEIAAWAFQNCTSLESFTIPETVYFIDALAFNGCTGLKNIYLSKPVSTIHADAFTGVTADVHFTYDNRFNSENIFQNYGGQLNWIGTMSPIAISAQRYDGEVVIDLTLAANAGRCYELYRTENPEAEPEKIAEMDWGEYTFYDDIDYGKTYYYTVKAVGYNENDINTYSNQVCVTREAKPAPVVPKATLSSVATTTTGLKVTWKKLADVTGYKIYRTTGTKYSLVKTITSPDTVSWTNTGLTSGTTYKYKVVAYVTQDGVDYEGTASSVKSMLYMKRPTISSVANKKTYVLVSWKKIDKATGYEIRYSTKSSFSSYKTLTVTKQTSSGKIKLPSKNKYYYFKMRSYRKDSAGKKQYSAFSTVKKGKMG